VKIIYLQNIDGVAGSEKYFLALIPKLIDKSIDVTMYCVVKHKNKQNATEFLHLLEENNIPYVVQYVNSYGSIAIPYKINKFIKENAIDIVHTHLIYADFWGVLIKKLFNKKVKIVSTKHGYHEETYVKYCNTPKKLPKNLYYWLFKFTHKNIDYSYACSYGLKNFYEKGMLIKENSMDVIQHGFNYPDIPLFDESEYRFSNPQLIIVGRLIKRKGHHFVFEILPEICKEFPDLKLIILGSGELENELKALAKSLSIDKHIEFLGFKTEVAKYLSSSDVALVPSYSEGLPLVIFEAFNAKTPVVSFDSIGCNELIIDGETGFLAKSFDKTELLNKTIELLKNKALQKHFSDNGYAKLKTYFSLKRMTEDTYSYYIKVLK